MLMQAKDWTRRSWRGGQSAEIICEEIQLRVGADRRG